MGFNIFNDVFGVPDPFACSSISAAFGGMGPDQCAKSNDQQVAQQTTQDNLSQLQQAGYINVGSNGQVTAGSGSGSSGGSGGSFLTGSTILKGVPNWLVLGGGAALLYFTVLAPSAAK